MDTTEVEQLIAKTGLQKKEISELLDIPPATLNRYKNGVGKMPEEKLEQLRKLAGGAKPALRALGTRKPAAAVLAEVPATALIEELARRARAGRINEPGATSLDASRRPPLRAVAFTDVPDD